MVQIENDVYSQIGLVMLIGLTAKNAILIVEFAKDEFEKGKPLVDAALEGARVRLRPILMTSFAFILGCVPLWTASGAGSVARQIMGTTVIGGMAGSQRPRHFSGSSNLLHGREDFRGDGRAPLYRYFRNSPCLGQETNVRKQTIFTLVILIAGMSVGCTLGPNYQRPSVQVPTSFRAPDPLPPAQGASIADLKWFEVFKDEQLQELVRRALERNYDLRDAVARVEEARASLGITRSNQFPNFGAGGGVDINRLSRDGETPLPPQFLPSQNRNFGTAALQLTVVRNRSSGAGCGARQRPRARIF